MFACVRERRPRECARGASGRRKSPAVRGGLRRTGAKLRALPPGCSPPSPRDRRASPGSLTLSSPPRSRGHWRAPQPARGPRRPSHGTWAAQRLPPQRSGDRRRGSLAGMEGGQIEIYLGAARGLLRRTFSLRSYLVWSGKEGKMCRVGIVAGKGVCGGGGGVAGRGLCVPGGAAGG